MNSKQQEFEKWIVKAATSYLSHQDRIICIDSHTGGEPTRVVVGGLPKVEGSTISERSDYFQNHYDTLRSVLTNEPRAHQAMHAFLLMPPTREDTDFGVIIACALGYLGMCGHGLIGTVYTAVECGIVPKVEPETLVRVETPSGIIEATAKVKDGKVDGVTFRNQPSFVYKLEHVVRIKEYGDISVSIAYGGNWYVVVNVEQLGIEIGLKNLDKFGSLNNDILEAVNHSIQADHPVLGAAGMIPQMIFYGPPKNPQANSMNLVTSQALGFDRSPCGTGSSAKMAVLHAKGELGIGQTYVHESGTTGSLFSSRLVEEVKVGSYDAVIPELTGFAYITGINQIIMDPRDSLRHGFSLH